MINKLDSCMACPHNCKVNRNKNQKGRCKCDSSIKIGLYSLHQFEEPCISGKNGSGTVFFTNCNLNCIYCQNYEISQKGNGIEISIEDLVNIFLKQQENGAENINLVTPTMYVYQIIEAIKAAKEKGLTLPIIYNTNSYENIETLKLLDGYIDVYLPDFKYFKNSLGEKYSNVKNYFDIASKAILEMYMQVGLPKFDSNGMIKKGMIIRHLVLPNHIENTKNILNWIKENLPAKTYISLMAQYFPTYKAKEDNLLNRKLSSEEYTEVLNYLYSLNLENGYFQELGSHEEEYVPNFNLNSLL